MGVINTGWLTDFNDIKFAPKTLFSQVYVDNPETGAMTDLNSYFTTFLQELDARKLQVKLDSDSLVDFKNPGAIGVTGILDIPNGGTGLNTITQHSLLIGNKEEALTLLPSTAGFLVSKEDGTAPLYSGIKGAWANLDSENEGPTFYIYFDADETSTRYNMEKIPVASAKTAGVVSTGSQTFEGGKIFKATAAFEEDVGISGKLDVADGVEIANGLQIASGYISGVINPVNDDHAANKVYVDAVQSNLNDLSNNVVGGTNDSGLTHNTRLNRLETRMTEAESDFDTLNSYLGGYTDESTKTFFILDKDNQAIAYFNNEGLTVTEVCLNGSNNTYKNIRLSSYFAKVDQLETDRAIIYNILGEESVTEGNDHKTRLDTHDTNITDINNLDLHVDLASDNSIKLGASTTNKIGVDGILPIKHGGTGISTAPTPGGIIYGASASAFGCSAAGTQGQVLQSNVDKAPTWITATDAATGSTIMKRDSSGNVSAKIFKGIHEGNIQGVVETNTEDSYSLLFIQTSGSAAESTSSYTRRVNKDLSIALKEGTTSTVGLVNLKLGNNIASGNDKNKRGILTLYGTSQYYTTIQTAVSESNKTITIPNYTGNMLISATSAQDSTVSGGTNYKIPFYINDGKRVGYNSGLRYNSKIGTTSDVGQSKLYLGNATAEGGDDNKFGALVLYSNGTSCQTLRAYRYSTNSTETEAQNRTTYLRDYGNTAYLAATTTRNAVGSETLPVYVNSSGVLTACTAEDIFGEFSSTAGTSGETLKITVAGKDRTLTLDAASTDQGGVVTTGEQTFAGLKIFNDNITVASAINCPRADKPGYLLFANKICFIPDGKEWKMDNSDLIIGSGEVYPGTTGTVSLGTSNYKWSNVYATTFNGAFSGTHTGSISGITETNPTSATYYSPIFINTGNSAVSSSTSYPRYTNKDFNIYMREGTATVDGYLYLEIGNNTASGTAGNKYGGLRLYSASTNYINLRASILSATATCYLPNGGTLLSTNYIVGKSGTNYGTASQREALSSPVAGQIFFQLIDE